MVADWLVVAEVVLVANWEVECLEFAMVEALLELALMVEGDDSGWA